MKSIDELTYDQKCRLVRHFWQFDNIDISDIPSDISVKFFTEFAIGKNVNEVLEKRIASDVVLPVTRRQLKSGWIKAVAALLIGASVVMTSIWIVGEANAQRARFERTVKFTNSMTEVLFCLYEENPVRTAEMLDQIDRSLPIHVYEEEKGIDASKMHACRIAVRSLLASRQGHVGESVNRLGTAIGILEKGIDSEIDLLDFLFLLTVGKAALEANNITAQGYVAQNGKKVSLSPLTQGLEKALEMLDSGFNYDWTQDELALLKGSLHTDIARARIRQSGLSAPEKTALAENQLMKARQYLELVVDKDERYQLAAARELNNRLLMWNRKQQLNQTEFMSDLDSVNAEINGLAVAQSVSVLTSSVKFERALCHSNFADILFYQIESGTVENVNIVEREDYHRREATKLLSSIPHAARTERCNENHFLNRVRPVIRDVVFGLSQLEGGELRYRAEAFDSEIGGVFETTIGQFNHVHRLAIATLLPEKYSNKKIVESAKNALNIFEKSSTRNSRLDNYEKWVKRLIKQREAGGED